MTSHVDWGHQLLAIPKATPERLIEALQSLASTAERIAATLKLDVSDFVTERG
jgi:hypothetical protein